MTKRSACGTLQRHSILPHRYPSGSIILIFLGQRPSWQPPTLKTWNSGACPVARHSLCIRFKELIEMRSHVPDSQPMRDTWFRQGKTMWSKCGTYAPGSLFLSQALKQKSTLALMGFTRPNFVCLPIASSWLWVRRMAPSSCSIWRRATRWRLQKYTTMSISMPLLARIGPQASQALHRLTSRVHSTCGWLEEIELKVRAFA